MDVGVAIVPNIMAKCSQEQSKLFRLSELSVFYHFLAFQYEMAVLCHIRPMQIIVVEDVSIVQIVYLGEKLQELMVVN